MIHRHFDPFRNIHKEIKLAFYKKKKQANKKSNILQFITKFFHYSKIEIRLLRRIKTKGHQLVRKSDNLR